MPVGLVRLAPSLRALTCEGDFRGGLGLFGSMVPAGGATTERLLLDSRISRMQIHAPTPAQGLNDRTVTWITLHNAGAHVLWLPRMIDVAINNFPATTDIRQLTESPSFHSACANAFREYGSPVKDWSPPFAAMALRTTEVAAMYTNSQVRRIAKVMKVTPEMLRERAPDADFVIRNLWLGLAQKYRAGRIEAGKLQEWGYEAFLAKRLPYLAKEEFCRAFRHARQHSAPAEDWEEPAWTPSVVEDDASCLRTALLASLDVLLVEPWRVAAYELFAYGCDPMGSIQWPTAGSYYLFHVQVFQPLCQAFAKAREQRLNHSVRFGPEVRLALSQMLPHSEFAARYRCLPLPASDYAKVPKEDVFTLRSNSAFQP